MLTKKSLKVAAIELSPDLIVLSLTCIKGIVLPFLFLLKRLLINFQICLTSLDCEQSSILLKKNIVLALRICNEVPIFYPLILGIKLAVFIL